MLKTNLLIGKLRECNKGIKADDYNSTWVGWFKVHGDNIWHILFRKINLLYKDFVTLFVDYFIHTEKDNAQLFRRPTSNGIRVWYDLDLRLKYALA